MSLRETEADSIRAFVEVAADRGCFQGRVLDFGAGRQPYRSIVEGLGAIYVPFDRIDHPASCATTDVGDDDPLINGEEWNAILCTQVIQYVDPPSLLADMYCSLVPGGSLVITGPTNWPTVEREDRHRFTLTGIVAMLGYAGFPVVEADYRAHIVYEGERWPIGWGAIATKADS